MKDMDTLSGRTGQAQQPFGRSPRGISIAPDGMACDITRLLLAQSGAEPILVLAVKGGAAGDL